MNNKEILNKLTSVLTSGLSSSDIKFAMVAADISERITEERIARKMTQKEFAECMGVSQSMVSKWESGDYNFTIGSAVNIFDKLGLDFSFSVTSSDEWNNAINSQQNVVINFTSPANSTSAKYDSTAIDLCVSA